MRRKDKKLQTDAAAELLTNCEYGVLSTVDKTGQPYGIPLNFVYRDNHVYFHSALAGRKIENIKDNPMVSFCAVKDTKVLPSEFTTQYKSVVVSGIASEAHGIERKNALLWLIEKYSPAHIEKGKAYIEKHDKATKVIKIEIESISGKKSPPEPG